MAIAADLDLDSVLQQIVGGLPVNSRTPGKGRWESSGRRSTGGCARS